MIKGITFGVFDLFHAGHVLMLREAKQHCDHLTVCIQVDPSKERNWKNKPIQTVLERELALAGCQYVDQILVYETEQDLENLLHILDWDIRFLGADYEHSPITAEWTRVRCFYTKRGHEYSTSELRKRVKDAK